MKLLLVEDNPADVRLMREMLKDAHGCIFELNSSDRLDRALIELDAHVFDAVLLDLGLPDSKGLETLLRTKQSGQSLPVVVLTGLDDNKFATEAVRAGAEDYLVKGRIDPELLTRTLTYAVERHRSRRELRESEARKAAILSSALDAIITIDHEGRILEFNPAAEQMFGFAVSDVIGREMAGLIIPPALREAHRRGLEHYMSTSEGPVLGRRIELTALRSNDEEFPIELAITRIGDIAPPVFTGFIRDLTQRKQAEAARRAAEDKFRQLVERSLVGIYIIQDGRFAYVNPRMEEIFGYTAGEMTSQPLSDFIVEQDHAMAMENLRKRIAGEVESVRYHLRMLRKDGAIVQAEVHGGRSEYQGRPAVMGTLLDVTGQMETIEALRESEGRFRQLAENIDEGFWMTTPDRRQMLYISPVYAHIWGRSCESLHQSPEEWIEAVHPNDRARVQEAFFTNELKNTCDVEFRIIRPDGSVRWVRDRAFPVRDADGNLLRIVGITEDITEHKDLEAQVFRSQRVESLGTLASGIAHDLNNILTPILMSSTILTEMLAEDSEAAPMIETINLSAQRGSDIVKQILTFALGVEGERISLPPHRLAKDLLKMARETFPKGIEITSDLPEDLWLVTGDPTQLHQVLLNLLVNARDAIKDRGMINLMAENIMLDEELVAMFPGTRPGPHVKFAVSDTGSGIPREVLDKIFDPFFTTKEQGKGTGLGLSTVMGIVKSHGGCVTVYSEPGKGTKFEIHLPATLAAASNQVNPTEEALPAGRGQLVLVVDDEEAIRKVVKHMLTRHGFRVITAADGAEGVAVFAQHRSEVRVILTDMMMPNLDGTSMVRAIRRMNSKVPVIAASGLGSAGAAGREDELKTLGVEHRLSKPYSVEKLITTLHELLKQPVDMNGP